MAKPKRRKEVAATEGVRAQLAVRMRQLREDRGLNQGDMAATCGVSKVYYGVLELGKKSASLETLDQIAQGLGMPLSELLRFDAPPDAAKQPPAERLGRRIAAMAHGADETQIRRLERVARILLEAEGEGSAARAPRSPRATRSKPGQ
jgi:transcriptional regulator with XRE-family HTH domain